MPVPSPPEPGRTGPATLRIVLDGVAASAALRRIAGDDAAVEAVTDGAGALRLEWVRHETGWFEGHPLRLELVAVGAAVAADEGQRRRLWALADAVVAVVEATEAGAAAARPFLRQLTAWAAACEQRPRCTVFAQRATATGDDRPRRGRGDRALDPAAVLAACGLSELDADPHGALAVATAADGAGVRYGLAMAVRSAIDRLRRRDAAGAPRTLACPATALAAALDGAPDGRALRATRTPGRRPGRVPVPVPPAAPGDEVR